MASDTVEPLLPAGDHEPETHEAECSGGACSRPPGASRQAVAQAQAQVQDNGAEEEAVVLDTRSLWTAVATLCFSLPALVGSCCWPLLLAGILGISATAGAKALSHTVSFATILAIVSNLCQYTYWRSLSRTGSTWRRLGPTILLAAAIPLVTADPLRHVLQDSGVWSGPSSGMYRPGCGPVRGLHGFWCLSVTGACFQLATYIGFALMISGVVWQADLIPKLRAAWRDIKRARAQGAARQQVGANAV